MKIIKRGKLGTFSRGNVTGKEEHQILILATDSDSSRLRLILELPLIRIKDWD